MTHHCHRHYHHRTCDKIIIFTFILFIVIVAYPIFIVIVIVTVIIEYSSSSSRWPPTWPALCHSATAVRSGSTSLGASSWCRLNIEVSCHDVIWQFSYHCDVIWQFSHVMVSSDNLVIIVMSYENQTTWYHSFWFIRSIECRTAGVNVINFNNGPFFLGVKFNRFVMSQYLVGWIVSSWWWSS